MAGVRKKDAKKILALKEKYGEKLHLLQMDVADTKLTADAAIEASKIVECIDVVINNAGVHSKTSFEVLEETNLDECEEVYDIKCYRSTQSGKGFFYHC